VEDNNMMIWEGSKNELVNLCNEFRKAVVAELQADPALSQKILGAFTSEELSEFDGWSKAALAKSQILQQTGQGDGNLDVKILEELDQIVLDMSEKSAEVALRVLGESTLKKFVKSEDRTQEQSDKFKKINYPFLAKVFAP
jgi:hypothetical protein